MPRYLVLVLALTLTSPVILYGQKKQLLQKSWIKTGLYSLPDGRQVPDTTYTRYTFLKKNAIISFTPNWDGASYDWSLDGNKLTLGFGSWEIEELTDSTLTLTQPEYSKIKLCAEEYLVRDSARLIQVGEFNNEPVYKGTWYVTPRWKKGSLEGYIHKAMSVYEIRKASYFEASYIITKQGTVENVKVLSSIIPDFDATVVDLLKKTSGQWIPAAFHGQPVQTQLIYHIKYLDSITR
ncbi:MAG TPA: energy transducer TonB [Puia sp.]|nr:energy transducer TonB [Puia sp.]